MREEEEEEEDAKVEDEEVDVDEGEEKPMPKAKKTTSKTSPKPKNTAPSKPRVTTPNPAASRMCFCLFHDIVCSPPLLFCLFRCLQHLVESSPSVEEEHH